MPQNNQSNNKRIAKNTMMLYIRMFVMMAVSLFTSRIILQVLGETDYGIYNIIGGVVIFFSFMNTALLQATQRFLNFELGKKNDQGVKIIFCMSMNSYLILALLFLVVAETIGLWFVNTQLNIPSERMIAANWVFQFSIITFIIYLVQVPYNATIIAYEQMDFFAYLSLLEVVIKLISVYLLFIISWDKLILFSFFYTITPLLINLIYKIYCNRHYPVTHYHFFWDGNTFKKLFSFSGWSLFGSVTNMLASQGINIVVNIFCCVVLNAALGIANQVSAKVNQFMTNFQMAFNPQIVKLYASKEYDSLYNLIFRASKFSYYLMLALTIPLFLKMEVILRLWLVEVPQYTGIFAQLMFVYMLIEALNGPLWMYSQATGDIKNYQIMVGVINLLNFPLVYLCLKYAFPVWMVWIVRILVNLIVSCARYIFMRKVYVFPIVDYFKNVLLPVCIVTVAATSISVIISNLIEINAVADIAITFFISWIVSIVVMYHIGLSMSEKEYIHVFLKSKIINKFNK